MKTAIAFATFSTCTKSPQQNGQVGSSDFNAFRIPQDFHLLLQTGMPTEPRVAATPFPTHNNLNARFVDEIGCHISNADKLGSFKQSLFHIQHLHLGHWQKKLPK
jgi:hypothetical protein